MGLPAEFDIHYMYQHEDGRQASENDYYNKIATCVLQSVNVDYTPGGVNSHVMAHLLRLRCLYHS